MASRGAGESRTGGAASVGSATSDSGAGIEAPGATGSAELQPADLTNSSGSDDRASIEMAADDLLEIKYVPIGGLIPYARNARTHGEDQLADIRNSMLEFGWTNPVLLNGEQMMLAGHGRVIVAADIWREGLTIRRTKVGMVPCLDLAGMSPEQQRAYIIADNKIPEKAGWDKPLLAMELADLKDLGYDVALTGFKDDDLQRAVKQTSGVTEIDVHELTDRFWISIRGPMRHQAHALKALRDATQNLEGVTVELGTIDDI